VQAVLAGAFVGVFWAVLMLGAELFRLLDVERVMDGLGTRAFYFPATTLALAVGVHGTDVQPALTRGVRALVLTLVAWLTPVFVAILLGFLASLPFLSLAPLWGTHFAAMLLLAAACLLAALINAVYQDGAATRTVPPIMRLAVTIGVLELLPLVGLAGWALALRVGQYGWTVERVLAAAVCVVAGCYALGSVAAMLRSPSWLSRLGAVNVATAWMILGMVLALFSPLADPARLMVADQMARLRAGAVKPEAFDYAALRTEGGRWGAAALQALSRIEGVPGAATIRRLATAALEQRRPGPVAEESVGDRMVVFPPGRDLVAAAHGLRAESGSWAVECLQEATAPKCIARFLTLRPGEAETLVVFDPGTSEIWLLQPDAAGRWTRVGQARGPTSCEAVAEALRRGEIEPAPHSWPDLMVGGRPLVVEELPQACPLAGFQKHG